MQMKQAETARDRFQTSAEFVVRQKQFFLELTNSAKQSFVYHDYLYIAGPE